METRNTSRSNKAETSLPSLKLLCLDTICRAYNLDSLLSALVEDETATAGHSQYPGIRFFKTTLDKKISQIKSIEAFLLAIIENDLDKASALLKSMNSTSRKPIDDTPYQQALRAEDEKMQNMLLDRFRR